MKYTALALILIVAMAFVPAAAMDNLESSNPYNQGGDLEVFNAAGNTNTVVFRSGRGSQRETVERIKLLIRSMKNGCKATDDCLGNIDELINKTWYFNADFEADQTVMLAKLRETLDQLGGIASDLEAVKAELFDPSALGVDDMIKSVEATGKHGQAAYNSMRVGSSELAAARTSYGKTQEYWAKTKAALLPMLEKLEGSLPAPAPAPAPDPAPAPTPDPVPAPEPAPSFDPANMTVVIINERVKFNESQTVLGATPEGKAVITKMKSQLRHLSTIERLQINQALKGQAGFSYVIRKVQNNVYYFYWWNLLNEIGIDTDF